MKWHCVIAWTAAILGAVGNSYADSGPTLGLREIWKETLAAAREVPGPTQRISLFLKIAVGETAMGNCSDARALLAECLETAMSLADETERDRLLVSIAESHLMVGDAARAEVAVRCIIAPGIRDYARFQMGQALVERNDPWQAIAVSRLIHEQAVRDASFAGIAESWAGKYQLDSAAWTAINSIQDQRFRSTAILLVALSQIELGCRETAKCLVQYIEERTHQIRALCEIAKAEWNAGCTEAARQTFLEAQSRAAGRDAQTPALIVVQALLGDLQGALAAASAIDERKDRDSVLSQLAISLVKHQHLQEAGDVVRYIQNDFVKQDTLSQIALRQAELGDDRAALQTAKELKLRTLRTAALRKIAAIQVMRSELDIANATLAIALQDAREIRSEGGTKVIELREIAVVQAQADHPQLAASVFLEAVAATDVYEDAEYRATLLADIAKTESRAGLPHQALEWARRLKLVLLRASALAGIVEGTQEIQACETADFSAM